MNEAWLSLGGSTNAARIVAKRLTAMAGIGIGQLDFQFEITATNEAAASSILVVGGRVEFIAQNAGGRYVGRLVAERPVELPKPGGYGSLSLMIDLPPQQLKLMERYRSQGDLTLRLWLTAQALRNGAIELPHINNIDYVVPQSHWVQLLEQLGHQKLLLLELEAPRVSSNPELASAIRYFEKAQHQYLAGEWRLTVESLRQCLAALVGKDPEDEDTAAEIKSTAKTTKTTILKAGGGYEERHEPVRQALKFLCDLGAHPEVTETRPHHARSALIMTGGLLQGVAVAES